ncbi:MAG: phosphodiester glycosidase family protein [bacterium]
MSVHVLVVDLQAPGVVVEVTPYEQRWMKPSQYGRRSGAVAAINGGFWSVFDQQAEGLVMHGGRPWPRAQDDEFYGFFGIRRDGRATISDSELVVRRVGELQEAISGLQVILADGKVTKKAFCEDGCRYRHPRTAVGISRDGRTVYLAVVDGRLSHSRGISLANLATLLAGLGVDRAINLDGGGSAAMYLATRKGLVNRPADRKEREVLNHIGVFWRPTKAQLAALRDAAAKPRAAGKDAPKDRSQPVLQEPPKPSTAGVPTGFQRFLQRHWREIFSPRNLLFAIPGLLAFAGLGVWVVRRRRREHRPPA